MTPSAREVRDHLAERGVLAADVGDVVAAELGKRNRVTAARGASCYVNDGGETLRALIGAVGTAAPMNRRTVFFVSDQTGVTAETMGHSLLTQFEGLEFRQVTLPFISTR